MAESDLDLAGAAHGGVGWEVCAAQVQVKVEGRERVGLVNVALQLVQVHERAAQLRTAQQVRLRRRT